jgi:hypothetical protein
LASLQNGALGRDTSSSTTHVARPLTDLRDPASFAPPPKRTGSGLAPPPPPTDSSKVKRTTVQSPSKYQDPRAPNPAAAPPKISHAPGQLGYQDEQDQAEQQRPRGPFQVDTTGLSTNHLPPPPKRGGADGRAVPAVPAPPSYETALSHPKQNPSLSASSPTPPAASSGPGLPPRLPARTNTGSTMSTPTTPVASHDTGGSGGGGLLNQSAMNRLGASGISVPSLGIGNNTSSQGATPPPPPPPPRQTPTSTGAGSNAQVSELQNRFARFNTGGTAPSENTISPAGGGTTWAQKQAALKTATSLQKDPSSVSLSDAKNAASTASNFHQRHGEQVAAGVQSANRFNQKFGVASKLGGVAGGQQQQQPVVAAITGLAGKKKPPPPPPAKKKPGLGGAPAPHAVSGAAEEDAPPPIPMATRPQF